MSGPESIDLRWRPRETLLYGQRVMIMEVEIPDDAPDDVKEGWARRALVNEGKQCPCGARAVPPDRAARRRAARRREPVALDVQHAYACPAWFRGYGLVDMGRWDA